MVRLHPLLPHRARRLESNNHGQIRGGWPPGVGRAEHLFQTMDIERLNELYLWMVEHGVLEAEVNGVRLKLAESALDDDDPPTTSEDEDDEEAPPPATHESIRLAALRKKATHA